ncbi:Uncharacterised protein [uncultured archaeon]|nr:Uncharacterised protein [uncultured archaeon]
MIKSIKPKTVKVKSKTYSSIIEVQYKTADKRVKYRRWTDVNGFIVGYLREFKASDYLTLATEFDDKNKPLNELKFMIAPQKVLGEYEPDYNQEVCCIIKGSMVIGLYPSEQTKEWKKGIDLLQMFKDDDFPA